MKFITPVFLALVVLLSFTSTSSAQNVECEVCKFVVNYADNLLAKNDSINQITTELEMGCKFLPKDWASMCTVLVDQYTPEIIQMLINEANPATVCSAISMCPSTKLNRIHVQTKEKKPAQKVGGGVQCTLCNFVAEKVESYIKANATTTQIVNFLNKDCKYLRQKSWVNMCQALVQNYAPQIIADLENQVSPGVICSMIGVCMAPQKEVVVEVAPLESQLTCLACEQIVTFAENYITKESTVDSIATFLSNECAAIEPKAKGICQLLIANYLPLVIELIEKQNPQQICQAIKFC
eukprot:gene2790-3470_t